MSGINSKVLKTLREKFNFNSLSKKLICAIALWLIGAVFFVGLTLYITWKLEDRGVAINEAGSLRKQTYYMVILAQANQQDQLNKEIKVFEQKIQSLSKIQNPTFGNPPNNLANSAQFQLIAKEFKNFKKKLILAQNSPEQQILLTQEAPLFIENLDQLVKRIETQNTYNIQIMRISQVLLILMIFLSALLSLYLLNRLILNPLSIINHGLLKIKQGQLSTRLDLKTSDELHQVSNGFNLMASSLENLYQHLEEKVQQKTQDLEKTNHELTTLYNITDYLYKMPFDQQTLDVFLKSIINLSFAKAGSIRLLNQQGAQMWTAHHINVPEELLNNDACTKISACLCGQSLEFPDTKIDLSSQKNTKLLCKKLGVDHLMVYNICLREQPLGILTLYFEDNLPESQANQSLIQLLCGQLAYTIENNRLILKEKQFAVLEERNIISQGLHDSIAQSLSFMNLQLQMLGKAFQNKNDSKITQHLQFLDIGIQQCYDDVRELLNNFRLKLHQNSFKDILISVIDRFKKQIAIKVIFNYQSTGSDLTPQQHIQLIFILQEALSNIRKHAQASQVIISFKNTDHIYLGIADNGVGFNFIDKKEKQGHHIGLAIMQERIQQVNGQFHIESSPNAGTCIEVIIQHLQL